MKESDLYLRFHHKIKRADPNAWCYKIPDTKGLGGKRPFDMFLLIQGVAICIEFKSHDGKLTKYQDYQMKKFTGAGGYMLIFFEGLDNMDNFIHIIMELVKNNRKGVKK